MREIEQKIMDCIIKKFGLSKAVPADVTEIDNRILSTERRDVLLQTGEKWVTDVFKPVKDKIWSWTPDAAEHTFLQRYAAITGK